MRTRAYACVHLPDMYLCFINKMLTSSNLVRPRFMLASSLRLASSLNHLAPRLLRSSPCSGSGSGSGSGSWRLVSGRPRPRPSRGLLFPCCPLDLDLNSRLLLSFRLLSSSAPPSTEGKNKYNYNNKANSNRNNDKPPSSFSPGGRGGGGGGERPLVPQSLHRPSQLLRIDDDHSHSHNLNLNPSIDSSNSDSDSNDIEGEIETRKSFLGYDIDYLASLNDPVVSNSKASQLNAGSNSKR